MDGEIDEIWQMEKFKSVSREYLEYILSVELA